MKDNFSADSDRYLKYRPDYPDAFFDFLYDLLPRKELAWDCGTGTGQVAARLSQIFEMVMATDISDSQLSEAPRAENITYSKQPAEHTDFVENSFDLVVAAQAIHWFDFERFYGEVRRTSKDRGIICAVGYGNVLLPDPLCDLFNEFYNSVVGPYWDPERRYLDKGYKTIPFPFDEISAPAFSIEKIWSLDQLIGYISTWSAVKHFSSKMGFSPMPEFSAKLKNVWQGDREIEAKFPLLLRVGRVLKRG